MKVLFQIILPLLSIFVKFNEYNVSFLNVVSDIKTNSLFGVSYIYLCISFPDQIMVVLIVSIEYSFSHKISCAFIEYIEMINIKINIAIGKFFNNIFCSFHFKKNLINKIIKYTQGE